LTQTYPGNQKKIEMVFEYCIQGPKKHPNKGTSLFLMTKWPENQKKYPRCIEALREKVRHRLQLGYY